MLRRREGCLVRLLHCEGEPVAVRAWVHPAGIRLRAEAGSRAAAAYGLDRMRFALGIDHDLADFQRAFRRDPLLGPVIRRRPWLRPPRRPEAFEALAWAISEQLIDAERAIEIQRRIVRRLGPTCGTLRDVPSATTLAARSPAELDACGLAPKRSAALRRAAREIASGRVDLGAASPEDGWRRLRRIPNIGAWTLEKLALHGQGRDDQLPAGDLAYLKLVGSLAAMGRRASEEEVRAFFARYEQFAGLAGLYALSARRSHDHRGRRMATRRRESRERRPWRTP